MHGQGQNSEQKHKAEKLFELHGHLYVLTMRRNRPFVLFDTVPPEHEEIN